MPDIDLKAATPDTTLPTTGFLFGADSQAAASPSVYSTQTVATALLGSTTLTGATVTADSPVLNLAQTWDDGGVTFTGLKFNATDTASASGSLLMDLQVGGSSRFNVGKTGSLKLGVSPTGTNQAGTNVTIAGSQGTGTGAGGSIIFQVAPAGSSGSAQNALATALTIASTLNATFAESILFKGGIHSVENFFGLVRLSVNSASAVYIFGNSTPILMMGGNTSSFPAIKRSSATLQIRLADDSGDANLTAKALTLSGNLTISTKDIVTDDTTGTKIGTATTQKIGFYNAAPVVQPSAVADATDAATVITQLNALLSRMRDLGLIAT